MEIVSENGELVELKPRNNSESISVLSIGDVIAVTALFVPILTMSVSLLATRSAKVWCYYGSCMHHSHLSVETIVFIIFSVVA